MNVTLYKFAKRHNSTARPGSGAVSLSLSNITWNDGASSILNPSIRVCKSSDWGQLTETDIVKYNYAYIANFARYYYINDWSYNGDGTWTADLDVDVLASWQLEIKASGGYVGRSSSHEDYWIEDSLYPATTDFRVKTATKATQFSNVVSNGVFVIGVISGQAPNIGAVSYYAMSLANLATLVSNIVGQYGTAQNPNMFSDITNLDSDVLKSLVNHMQFIVSCKWFTFNFPIGDMTSQRDYVWGWDTGANGYKLTTAAITQKLHGSSSVQFEGELYDWLQLPVLTETDVADAHISNNLQNYPPYAPFGQYSLITAWGTFELDPNIISNLYIGNPNAAYLYFRFVVNLISGTGTMIVGTQPYKESGTLGPQGQTQYTTQPFTELFRREVELGLDIPLAQVSYNYVQAGHNFVNLAQSAVSAGFNAVMTGGVSLITGDLSNVAHGVIDAAASALSPAVQSTGSAAAAFTELITSIKFQMIRYRTLHKNRNTQGAPYKQYVSSINSAGLTGFVQFDISEFTGGGTGTTTVFCTETEREKVKQFLESGVFLDS